jgi:hypothetical protein
MKVASTRATKPNNRDQNFTDRKLTARIDRLEDSIRRYRHKA